MKQLVSNLKGDKGFGHLYLIGLVFLMPVLALVVTWLILVKEPEIH
jgi:hypothetical protein